jgi:hypothetical protein
LSGDVDAVIVLAAFSVVVLVVIVVVIVVDMVVVVVVLVLLLVLVPALFLALAILVDAAKILEYITQVLCDSCASAQAKGRSPFLVLRSVFGVSACRN